MRETRKTKEEARDEEKATHMALGMCLGVMGWVLGNEYSRPVWEACLGWIERRDWIAWRYADWNGDSKEEILIFWPVKQENREQQVLLLPVFCRKGLYFRKGEGELGEAILAGDGDVFLVGIQDGFDDI